MVTGVQTCALPIFDNQNSARADGHSGGLEVVIRLHDPPLTKDAVAGRIRRLLATADKAAEAAGIPNMEASLPADLNDSQ